MFLRYYCKTACPCVCMFVCVHYCSGCSITYVEYQRKYAGVSCVCVCVCVSHLRIYLVSVCFLCVSVCVTDRVCVSVYERGAYSICGFVSVYVFVCVRV